MSSGSNARPSEFPDRGEWECRSSGRPEPDSVGFSDIWWSWTSTTKTPTTSQSSLNNVATLGEVGEQAKEQCFETAERQWKGEGGKLCFSWYRESRERHTWHCSSDCSLCPNPPPCLTHNCFFLLFGPPVCPGPIQEDCCYPPIGGPARLTRESPCHCFPLLLPLLQPVLIPCAAGYWEYVTCFSMIAFTTSN